MNKNRYILFMENILIPDILNSIFEYLDTKGLICASRVCRYWRKVYNDNISKYSFELSLYLKHKLNGELNCANNNTLKYLNGAYKLSVDCRNITDEGFQYFENSSEIHLHNTDHISPNSFKYLKNVQKLRLGCEHNLTDKHIKNLQYCEKLKSIHFWYSPKITNKSFKYLSNIEEINLGNTNITDEGLKYLHKLKKLTNNPHITENSFQYLTNLRSYHDKSNIKLTDKGLEYLQNIHTLHIYGEYITDDGLMFLQNIHNLHIDKLKNNCKITDNGLKYISGTIENIHLDCPTNITNDGLKYLKNCKTIKIICNDNITNDGLRYILNYGSVRHIYIIYCSNIIYELLNETTIVNISRRAHIDGHNIHLTYKLCQIYISF